MTVDDYLEQRVKQYRDWYDRKAGLSKSRYTTMRVLSVVGGAIVPVLVNLSIPYMSYFATAVSLLVVVLVSLEGVLHYREQWKNYRSTEQAIGHEEISYRARIGVYRGLDDQVAFTQFVERVEGLIRAENTATLNVLTVAAETKETRAAPLPRS